MCISIVCIIIIIIIIIIGGVVGRIFCSKIAVVARRRQQQRRPRKYPWLNVGSFSFKKFILYYRVFVFVVCLCCFLSYPATKLSSDLIVSSTWYVPRNFFKLPGTSADCQVVYDDKMLITEQ